MSPLCLLVVLAAPPVLLEADRLEVDADAAEATQLRVQYGDSRLTAPRAKATRTPQCADGDWTLTGPVRIARPGLDATTASARLCLPAGRLAVSGLSIQTPKGRLSAQAATLTGDRIEATALSATACACDDPPWRVTASSASAISGQGAWLSWPVLRLGGVPVLTAPTWYVPLSRRRTGLLAPRIGYDAEDGIYGALPVFVTLGQSADVTLAPGWRDGPYGDARLRWAADADEGGTLNIAALSTDGLRADGTGTLPIGPARLALEGEVATDRGVRQRLARTLPLRGRDHLRGTLAASLVGQNVGVGGRLTRLQDLRAQGQAQSARAPTIAETWISWTAPIGPTALRVDGQLFAINPEDASAGSTPAWIDLDGRFDTTLWWGPLRLRPVAGAATTVRMDTEAKQTSVGWLGAEAEIAAARDYGAVSHVVGLRLDGRVSEDSGQRLRRLPFDQPIAGRNGGVSVINRLLGDDTTAEVSLRAGVDDQQDVDWLSGHAAVQTPMLTLRGSVDGDANHWSDAQIEPVSGWGLRGGHSRLQTRPDLPSLLSTGTDRPWLLAADDLRATTLRGGIFAAPGSLKLSYDLIVDARQSAVLGQWGSAAWDGRCRCWRVGVQVSHERGRRWPDVLGSVTLGAL